MAKILDNINVKLYGDNREAQNVWRVSQSELDSLDDTIMQAIENVRATLADEVGISNWEQVYGITPDLQLDSLEDRRDRILEAKRLQTPFTERWLQQTLFDRTNDDSISAEVDWERLVLTLAYQIPATENAETFFQRRVVRETLLWLRRVVPANLVIEAFDRVAPMRFATGNALSGLIVRRKIWGTGDLWGSGHYWSEKETEAL